jgi:hypothetical protein
MNHPEDYKIICQPYDSDTISITTPTGEKSISYVRKDIFNRVGNIELTEIGLETFFKILPKDRIFRNAWKFNSTGIIEDIPLSKKIIKSKRNFALKRLDNLWVSESRKPKGNINTIDKIAKILRDIPEKESFKSSDINNLRGLMLYVNNVLNTISIDTDLLPQYINNTLFIKDDRVNFIGKLFSRITSLKPRFSF